MLMAASALLLMTACNKSTPSPQFKTAYVDTSKLMEDYDEAKDVRAKYEAKSTEMSKGLKEEIAVFQAEANSFRTDAQSKGAAWAQAKGTELSRREQQLRYKQDALVQQLQQESGTELDSLVSNVKKFIKSYGKEKGYDYIYGTGQAESILYAKDQYDLTKDILKALNDKYKSGKANSAEIKK
jgi:outer membrane protein